MSSSAPTSDPGPAGRHGLAAFFTGRTGIALAVMVAGALVAATAYALVGGDGDSATPQARVPDPRRDVPVGALFGAHTKVEEKEVDNIKAATMALEDHLGRKLDINHNFYPWDKEFPTDVERWDLEQGRIPMISWNGKDVMASEIASGAFDPMIQERAANVKALEKPIMIRWFWEMDGNKKGRFAESPAAYISAWRHIVDTFNDQGATNVAWVWCPNASAFTTGEAQEFHPGDEYVDWVCADGYNWAPGREKDTWETFAEIFSGYYEWASQQSKPIMVGEFGVQERGPGDKAAWVAETANLIKTEFPLIKAIVYFNANQDYDWRMNTSPEAYQAFKNLANDPFFDAGLNRRLPQ
ncbi:MAG: glycoside hydrolase family 26 protein [Acidimicrobiia bacterium]